MLNAQLAEVEQEFRKQWHGYQPHTYETFLQQVAREDQVALLARLISVELEYAYQPPNLLDSDHYSTSKHEGESGSQKDSDDDEELEEDERARPRVMLFLHRFPQLRQHRELLIQLVMLEFALRLRFDPKTPNYDSYLDLCPLEKERVGGMMQVMEEKLHRLGGMGVQTTETGKDDTTVSESVSQKQISLSQLPCSLGYFLLTDVIGKGGMGTVYNAVDLRSAAHVAVKIIHRADSWSVYRFIEEFTWLSTLNHPNVVKLYDTFSEGDLRYFSMEVVEGHSIRQWFQHQLRADRWNQLRRVLSQAALAVAFLHDHDVIHRDIKSSNLMISGRGRAVLLDLGLASRVRNDAAEESWQQPSEGEPIVGTLNYLPPEALHAGPMTFASDWYSFGVMMYETMTGSFPPVCVDLKAPTGSRDRYYLDVSAAERHLANCPRDLATLCLAMLNTEASERPAAREIIQRLGSDVGQPIPFSVTDADFIGRESGLAFLDQALATASQGSTEVRLVRGESGMGKTALVNRWLKRHVDASATLRLNIRCYSHDHQPLRALNLLVQELVTCLAKRPMELWQDLSRGGGEEIVYTFPQMERLGGPGAWPTLERTADTMEGMARRTAGLLALLSWLKGLSQRVPLIIVIDDAHWADAESGRFLSYLLRAGSEFRGLIVLIDQGASVPSPFLQSLIESEPGWEVAGNSYEIPPLTREECTQLLASWSARLQIELTSEVTDDLLSRSGGSPFLLQELLRSYVNYVVRHRLSDDTWLSGSQKTGSQKDSGVLHNRFSMLPPTTEKVLQFLAVSTQPLGIHQLQTASRILPGQLLAELNHLSGQGWIRWNGTTLDSELEISHERFRAVVLKSMMEDRLQRRHFRLARMLSSEVPPPWRRIAHHYSEARQYREAAACYMEGARAAASRLSYAEALWMLERAFHPQAQRTEAENRAAKRLQADCLAGHGNSEAAAMAYEELAREELTESTDSQAISRERDLMKCLAGEQWIRAGRLQQGLKNLRSVMNQSGSLSPQSGMLVRMMERLRIWRLLRMRPSLTLFSESNQPFSEIEQCLNRISGPLSFWNVRLGRNLIHRMFRLAQSRGTNFDRAISIMRWGLMLSCGQDRSRMQAIQWLRFARGLARHSGSQNARALAHVCMFMWHSLQGRFHASLQYARRAERLYEAQYASDTWETGFICWTTLAHLWYLGQLKELCDRTHSYRQDAKQRTDTMWSYWMHVNAAHVADLVRDDVEEGRRSLQAAAAVVSDDTFELPQAHLWISQVRQLLYEGEARAAYDTLMSKWHLLKSSSFMRMTYYHWLLDHLRILCDLACAKSDATVRQAMLQDALRRAKRMSSMEQETFRIYAAALRLVVDAADGRVAPAADWRAVLEDTRTHQLGLLEIAVQWHAESWHPTGFLSAVRQRLMNEGCVNPERLLNLVLPIHEQTT